MDTPITDSMTGSAEEYLDHDVVPAEWARELETDVKILFYRLLCEPEDSHAEETLKVMRKWSKRLEKEVMTYHEGDYDQGPDIEEMSG